MSVRIIAGSLRGRVLKTPEGLSTRPTLARAREAMFSILAGVEGASVLDLYAGSGALGIESLSRGAERALFVENDRYALDCLRDNVEKLGLGAQTRVFAVSAEAAPRVLGRDVELDLVFCDPPWPDMDDALTALAALVPRLRDGARVVLEHPAKRAVEIAGLAAVDTRRWGDTGATFFELARSDD
ncbi:MAG: 16S rRNA (guanine(966)-N(2))-methyltransferase RsmD [Myxococcota bacterium]|jgi:16S rRNA (guanine966-N2)-methyltransferase|nr:16S rRNA (guanine(966)-N(2))-methyltransferase RsmD [Myxococcota bacterium]